MTHYICIHSHFYQPPRENPWVEEVFAQDSASPYHDWNTRISHECYFQNGRSRILNDEGQIIAFTNNYSRMSFNFGPTLLSWMEKNDKKTYDLIIEGDQQSLKKFNGHGNAIAQCYNHIIMPLANRQDKITQIIWGIKDFEKHFKRFPEGMWLPETAVDSETLEILEQYGIKYVILAPKQAKSVRKIGDTDWINVSGERINTKISYQIPLKNGKKISAFFYDGALSKAVAFDGLLHNGEKFADRLMSSFSSEEKDQLVHIATDGESYGHHHRYGDMAFAYAVKKIEESTDHELTNYGQFLETNPPQEEALIEENSSWSCAHGIERWKSDCGCNSGGHPGWNQQWRAPLREALDFVCNTINVEYVSLMDQKGVDPWQIRNEYISVILHRNQENIKDFLLQNIPQIKIDTEAVFFTKSLEIQRQLLLMYTSCAWFFDEVSGIETVQNLKYALRAIELASEIFTSSEIENLEKTFVEKLALIKSNKPQLNDAKFVFQQMVKSVQTDFFKLTANFATLLMFQEDRTHFRYYTFDITLLDKDQFAHASNKILVGRAQVTSLITYSKRDIYFLSAQVGEEIIKCGVKDFQGDSFYSEFKNQVNAIAKNDNFETILPLISKHFTEHNYTLKDFLPDNIITLIEFILKEKKLSIEKEYTKIYEENLHLVQYLNSMNLTPPDQLATAFYHVLNSKLLNELSLPPTQINFSNITKIFQEIKKNKIALKKEMLLIGLEKCLMSCAKHLYEGNASVIFMTDFLKLVDSTNRYFKKMDCSDIQFYLYQWKDKIENFSTKEQKIALEILSKFKVL